MENYKEDTSSVGGILLSWPNGIVASGRLRTWTSKVGDEECDQGLGVSDIKGGGILLKMTGPGRGSQEGPGGV